MKKNPYKEAPANFSVCVHTDCTCGSTCLRQLAYPVLLERSFSTSGQSYPMH